jgi:hypothetical protein
LGTANSQQPQTFGNVNPNLNPSHVNQSFIESNLEKVTRVYQVAGYLQSNYVRKENCIIYLSVRKQKEFDFLK